MKLLSDYEKFFSLLAIKMKIYSRHRLVDDECIDGIDQTISKHQKSPTNLHQTKEVLDQDISLILFICSIQKACGFSVSGQFISGDFLPCWF